MLTKKEINHVADLAQLYVKEDEYERYNRQLTDILKEIEKINQVSTEDEIMISSTTTKNNYRQDQIGPMLSKEEIFKNASHVSGDYITVVKVIND